MLKQHLEHEPTETRITYNVIGLTNGDIRTLLGAVEAAAEQRKYHLQYWQQLRISQLLDRLHQAEVNDD